jgi:hypothetical protein
MATVLSILEKEGMATAELWPKAPWPFDGLVRCGQTTYLNAPAAVCAWSDDGTLGVIIAPAGSAGAMRDVPEAVYAARTSFGCRSRGAVAAAVESFGGTWTYLWLGDFMEKHPAVGAADQGDRHRRRALAGRGQHTRGDGRHRGGRRGRTAAGRDYGRAYSITGPEILTRVDLVRRIGQATGQHIGFIETTHDDAVARLASSMGDNADWYVDNVLAGMTRQPDPPTRTIEQVTGRPATCSSTGSPGTPTASADSSVMRCALPHSEPG